MTCLKRSTKVSLSPSNLTENLVSAEEEIPGFDVTLKIDTSSLPKTSKIKKTMDEETQQNVKKENEAIRKQLEEITDKIALKFSCFKRDFMGAPIRRAFLALKNGASDPKLACQIDYRNDEIFWVVPTKNEVTVAFGMQFSNDTDKALARISLLEFSDSKRHVKNPPAILYYDKDFPEAVSKAFPQAAQLKFSNGVISFSFQAGHMKPDIMQPMTFLIGFRQYLHYHIDAIKASLHARMRKRVETFQRVLTKAKRDQESEIRKFKETHGGTQYEDVKEEEKKAAEVFKYQKQ